MKDLEPFYVELGRLIQTKRNQNGMSQEYLGQQLDPKVTRASIANIEAGKQRVLSHTLIQLSRALKTDLKDLIPTDSEIDSVRQQPVPLTVETELARKLDLPKKDVEKLMTKIKTKIEERL